MSLAYLNGSYLPLSEARVPALDRGYLFGDGVYEVIPVYHGRPFRLQAHLQRLQRSLDALRLPNPLPPQQWQELSQRLLGCEAHPRQQLYLQVTRGVQASRGHSLPPAPLPAVFAYASAASPRPADLDSAGVHAITAVDIRWGRCDIKSIALLGHVLCHQQAIDAGCNEAILHRDGRISEGASSNVFVVIAGRILTPPTGHWLLAGITRDVVFELARSAGLDIDEQQLSLDDLNAAAEVWISSSTRELYPVTRIDQRPVGDGLPGPLWRQLATAYRQLVQAETAT